MFPRIVFLLVLILTGTDSLAANTLGAQSAPAPELSSHDLSRLAEVVVAMQDTAARAGKRSPIPSEFWPAEVRALSPVEVTTYRVNVVVTIRRSEREESGYYIGVPASSWFPQSGDGWTFEHLGSAVYRYTRALPR